MEKECLEVRNDGEDGIEEYISEDDEERPCYGRRCTANEQCCIGSVCVDVDGVVGSCLFAYGRRVGEICLTDNDCESGLLCVEADKGISRVCRLPVHQDKQYSELCNMSNECDISRGLCCQLQRRHRQAPRKVSFNYEVKGVIFNLRDEILRNPFLVGAYTAYPIRKIPPPNFKTHACAQQLLSFIAI
ncbi:hypothetical protein NQ317_007986 [Molorchus minor]|uniref:Prohormone-3 n=1 Tax=Molorchus minor TaxID=1323400 RepID=A0ABQ9JIY7_9CUCU|nr:hypothetical protein NQ317_007986 [Molorchus minor]